MNFGLLIPCRCHLQHFGSLLCSYTFSKIVAFIVAEVYTKILCF